MAGLQETLAQLPQSMHYMALERAVELFPAVSDWLVAQEHPTAQISHTTEHRLPSAIELMEAKGGVDVVKGLVLSPRGKNTRYRKAILSACSNKPMGNYEVNEYAAMLGLDDDGRVFSNTTFLRMSRELAVVDTIVHISKLAKAPAYVIVRPKSFGYQITDEGRGKLIPATPAQSRLRAMRPGLAMP